MGEVPNGPNQVVIGRGDDDALVPLGVVTGLEDSQSAMIIVWPVLEVDTTEPTDVPETVRLTTRASPARR